MPDFTPLQGQYLAFTWYYTKVNGWPPAHVDFQRFFGTTPPTVVGMLNRLEAAGWIAREPGTARSIRVTLPREQLPDLE
ncbi:MAG: LexA family protein [Pirellulaceae bacterium]